MHPAALIHGHEQAWSWLVLGVTAAALLAFAGLFVAALVSILGSRLSGGMKLAWVIFAFCAPFLGSLLWFAFGRRDAAEPVRR
ncbi:PLD nuclease N-terminal domain-containing protein [Amycolatopsis australiensis]|uniref:Phospholipase_D-nuclease N-terminal n=1 Tax=Amycolatopsis australiensis TaxID=546364 RepID=A0A1K1S5L2_9PSEU|nr:PLD nuclease N-terminal domain-containing protein [Amycolatopsis australiensis]SFW79490.1 Phospholipase_D-nuclease N-terminal [Amycolatopsis australiensis]